MTMKPINVQIVQIQPVDSSKELRVYGLGSDGLVYYWLPEAHDKDSFWKLYTRSSHFAEPIKSAKLAPKDQQDDVNLHFKDGYLEIDGIKYLYIVTGVHDDGMTLSFPQIESGQLNAAISRAYNNCETVLCEVVHGYQKRGMIVMHSISSSDNDMFLNVRIKLR